MPPRCWTPRDARWRTSSAPRWAAWSRSASRSPIPTASAPSSSSAPRREVDGLVQGGEDPSTVYRRNAWFLYGEETRNRHPERIEEDLVYRSKIPTQPRGYLGQLQAAMSHDTWDELATIAAPTLVVHGDADLLIPPENGRHLATRIPGARLVLVPSAGHMLQADASDAVRAAVLAFFEPSGPAA
jgi:pimeloyl-ACP methyl ester carboxylesterase